MLFAGTLSHSLLSFNMIQDTLELLLYKPFFKEKYVKMRKSIKAISRKKSSLQKFAPQRLYA